jgi:hypothetical protein
MENGFDEKVAHVVPVKVAITEISEDETRNTKASNGWGRGYLRLRPIVTGLFPWENWSIEETGTGVK